MTTTPTLQPKSAAYIPAADRYTVNPANWFRRCGRSGLMLPAISLGLWHNFGGAGTDAGGHTDEETFHENCRRMLFTAFDLGITHFDLANNYGPPPGGAEERFGRILKDFPAGARDEMIISTKAGWKMWDGPYGDWGSRKYLVASLDQSLKRMDMEYVDIFYHHRPDPETPMEESLGALDQIVRSGKALYAGISSYSGVQTAEAIRICQANGLTRPIIHQPVYSMFRREVERDLFATTQYQGVGTICFSPLFQGLLTDKYLHGIPKQSRAGSKAGFLKPQHVTEERLAKVQKLNDLAQQRGQSLAQMALAWVLRPQPTNAGVTSVTSALIGASSPQQVRDCVGTLKNAAFSEDEIKMIETILA